MQKSLLLLFMASLISVLSSCQNTEKEVVIVNQNPVLDHKNSSGGGVIDGGGSGYEYPSEKEIKAELEYAISMLGAKGDKKNFSIVLNDLYAQYDYNLYDDELTPENEVSEILYQLVGETTSIRTRKRRNCEMELNANNCAEFFPIYSKGVGNLIHKENVVLKDKCFDFYGEQRVGSVSSFSTNAIVCVSLSELKQIPTINLRKNIFSLLMHEATHMIGLRSEVDAEIIENFVSKNFDSVIAKIENTKEDIIASRKEILNKLVDIQIKLYKISNEAETAREGERPFGSIGPITQNFKPVEVNNTLKDLYRSIREDQLRFEIQEFYDFKNEYTFNQAVTNISRQLHRVFNRDNNDNLTEMYGTKMFVIIPGQVFSYEEVQHITESFSIDYQTEIGSSIIDKYDAYAKEINELINALHSILASSNAPLEYTDTADNLKWIEYGKGNE